MTMVHNVYIYVYIYIYVCVCVFCVCVCDYICPMLEKVLVAAHRPKALGPHRKDGDLYYKDLSVLYRAVGEMSEGK